MVVETSEWPSSAWMVRMSFPRCKRWVAKLCRKVCALTLLVIPLLRAAALMALMITLGSIWWRLVIPLLGSTESVLAGNTYCQSQSLAALDIFGPEHRACRLHRTPDSNPFTIVFWRHGWFCNIIKIYRVKIAAMRIRLILINQSN